MPSASLADQLTYQSRLVSGCIALETGVMFYPVASWKFVADVILW